jgi:hypothetical protein
MRSSRKWGRWFAVAMVVWVFVTLSLFYWVQKPLDLRNAVALGRNVLSLGLAALVGVAGLAIGGRLLHWLRLAGLSRGDRVVLGGGLGLGILGLATFGLGLLGVLSRWLFLGLLAALIVILWREIADLVRVARSLEMPSKGVALYVGLTLLLALLVALTPPTDFDGLFYHLTEPAWALAAGRIGPPQANVPHFSFPGLMEALFLLALTLYGDIVAKLLHWGFALLLGGLVYRIARRHMGAKLGWGAVVALYATPMVAVLAGWAYNDLALAFFQVAALYAVLNGFEGHGGRWFGLAGGLTGLAMGLKYTSFICPLTLIALVIWDGVQWKRSFRRVVCRVALFSTVALAVASPWYLRNLAFVGNPVYPFAYDLFGGQGWSRWHADWYAQAGTGIGGDLGALLALPVTLTLGLRDMNYFDGRTGPLFLAALPALVIIVLFGRRRPRALKHLLLFVLAQYAFWVAGVASSRSLFQSRLLLTPLVALCPALAFVYDASRWFDRPGFSIQRFVRLVVALVLVFNVVYQALEMIRLRPLPYLVGQESRDGFVTRLLGAHYLAMQVVAELPENARVQFLWEPRSYYSGRVVQPDSILEAWKYLCDLHDRDADAIAVDLREQGVTHLLLHVAGMNNVAREVPDSLSSADVAAWEAMRDRYLEIVWELPGAYVLYTWR